MQGYLLQMSAARSWLGLPLPPQQHEFTKSVGAQHAQQQASVTTHHSQASQLPGPQAGSRQIDIDKLLSVPSDIKQVAARATDAHAMLLKVMHRP